MGLTPEVRRRLVRSLQLLACCLCCCCFVCCTKRRCCFFCFVFGLLLKSHRFSWA